MIQGEERILMYKDNTESFCRWPTRTARAEAPLTLAYICMPHQILSKILLQEDERKRRKQKGKEDQDARAHTTYYCTSSAAQLVPGADGGRATWMDGSPAHHQP